MQSLEDWMEKELTYPDIRTIISGELIAWKEKQTSGLPLNSIFEGVNEAHEYQHRIGWGCAIEGYFSHR